MPKKQDDPSVRDMIRWIGDEHKMSKSELARMFQTSPAVIEAWFKNLAISDPQYLKLRRSYFFLNGRPDPHYNERKCAGCGFWKGSNEYASGQALCLGCVKKKADKPRQAQAARAKKPAPAARLGGRSGRPASRRSVRPA